jgi:hypothetical protein
MGVRQEVRATADATPPRETCPPKRGIAGKALEHRAHVRAFEDEDGLLVCEVDLVSSQPEHGRIERRALGHELPRLPDPTSAEWQDDRCLLVLIAVLTCECREQVCELVQQAEADRFYSHVLPVSTRQEQRRASVETLLGQTADANLVELAIRDAQLDAALKGAALEEQGLLVDDQGARRRLLESNSEDGGVARGTDGERDGHRRSVGCSHLFAVREASASSRGELLTRALVRKANTQSVLLRDAGPGRKLHAPPMSHSQRLALGFASVLILTAGAIAAAAGAFGSNSPASPPSFTRPNLVARVGPGRVATSLRAHGYRLELRLSPNRASAVRGRMSVTLSQNGEPVSGARIRLTFTMLDMKMDGLFVFLRQTAPGRYDRVTQRLMFGRWGLRVAVKPKHEKSFSVNLVDHVGI